MLVLLELQSTVDWAMATRMLMYCALAWESLIGQGSSLRPGLVPATLPVVFYNGASRWKASTRAGEVAWPSPESLGAHDLPPDNRVSGLIALENSRSPTGVVHTLSGVFEWFGGTPDRGFCESLYEWARHSPQMAQRGVLPAYEDLEGGTMPTLVEARAKVWKARWLREGHEPGVSHGVAQGPAQGKAERLRGQAAHKSGGAEGERVSALIEHIRDPHQLARVGGWLIECESASDLLARLERLPHDG